MGIHLLLICSADRICFPVKEEKADTQNAVYSKGKLLLKVSTVWIFSPLVKAFQRQDWFATNCFQWKLPRRPIFDLICCRRPFLILQSAARPRVGKEWKFPFPLFRIDSRRQPPMENLSKLVKRQGTGRRPGGEPTDFSLEGEVWSPYNPNPTYTSAEWLHWTLTELPGFRESIDFGELG